MSDKATESSPRAILLLPVFIPAVFIAVLLAIGTISKPELANQAFANTLNYLTQTFGWFYMLAVAFFLVFIATVAISSWGKTKLGPDHAEPQYRFSVWFAMLISAGYGIALMFFGVAEPVLHYAAPPEGAPETVNAAKQAMQIAFFHWGFHIWAIYGLTGLVLAYFAFRHGLPLSIRSALYPLIGERIYGPIGHTVDVFAILGTLFGIATTLGLSVSQINAGLNYLWDIPVSITTQVILIAVITVMATISVVSGLDRGIKNLSIVNLVLAGLLMGFVFLVGPSIYLLETFLQNTGSYLSRIVERTFDLQAYTRSDWIGNWTLFIFGWTIAWAPFVGLFIAKISRGRTIRQFVFGVLCVPTLVTFMWFSVFGNSALNLIMNEGYTQLITEVEQNSAIALFKLLEQLPFTALVSFVAIVLIMIFFVTSSDSGSLVVDSLASGGADKTPSWQRIFWSSMEGVIAAVLLIAGGLSALQAMTLISALPFAIIMILAAIGMWRALIIEGHRESSLNTYLRSHHPTNWRKRLSSLIHFPDYGQACNFVEHIAYPAMQRVANALAEQKWPVTVFFDDEQYRTYIEIARDNELDFIYEIRLISYPMPGFAQPQMRRPVDNQQYYRVEVFLRRGGAAYDIFNFSEQEVIDDILDQFEKYLHFLHISPGILPWRMQAHDDMLDDEGNIKPLDPEVTGTHAS